LASTPLFQIFLLEVSSKKEIEELLYEPTTGGEYNVCRMGYYRTLFHCFLPACPQ